MNNQLSKRSRDRRSNKEKLNADIKRYRTHAEMCYDYSDSPGLIAFCMLQMERIRSRNPKHISIFDEIDNEITNRSPE